MKVEIRVLRDDGNVLIQQLLPVLPGNANFEYQMTEGIVTEDSLHQLQGFKFLLDIRPLHSPTPRSPS